ncbi:pectate lyase [Bacteroides sp. 214]|uniref:pectate lyase n=1 Tax=Bacteroides sp. 214 TaxID=2302935 RepID=UPI0013CF7D1F|nr:pectate lyase [Bacteroides sp. 214]NDW13353.1 pectate lyase [Bacteroides sp. 214]
MNTNQRQKKALFIFLLSMCFFVAQGQNKKTLNNQILGSVKKATEYMLNTVSYNGGFVWEYLPDFSRQWGEMEAYRTMIWTQGQGTPRMGEFFLDLYHATGDEYYYQAAEKVAAALMWGQLPCGGWNYIIDFAGDASLKNWYETIGKNAWRLEEFQHYYGNATYDDDSTISPARFLLRMYVEKYDPRYKVSVDKTINFVLESQYPIGGWPQRYPLMYEYSKGGRADYSSYITYNDKVHENNINYLVLCYQLLGEKRLLDPIRRAMNCTLALHQGPDQPGWSDQYTLDYLPAGARSYEPRSLQLRTTEWCLNNLMEYYQWTGDKKFLARIPETLDWLERTMIPTDASLNKNKMGHTKQQSLRNIEIGTNKALFTYRVGSNVVNGEYLTEYGYGEFMKIDIAQFRKRYEELLSLSVEEVTKNSPFQNKGGEQFKFPDYNVLHVFPGAERSVNEILSSLTKEGYWLVPMTMTSNPYIGDGPAEVTPGNYQGVPVGDKYDTSPYPPKEQVMGITTNSYMWNVSQLINYYLKNKE